MQKTVIYLFLTLLSVNLSAQIETSIWYFGDNAGLDFRTGSPIALTDGALATREGCASICDKNGDILFYTEGTKVWNKNHEVMENGTGLLGDFSSTQSAIVIPKPGSEVLYYIITVPSVYNSGDAILRYSIIDLTYNNGLGKITLKNEIIFPQVVEKVTAVKKANGVDFWIITHERNSNKFLSFSLTSDGLDVENPQESNVGTINSLPLSNFVGYLKTSPLGNYLAYAIHGNLSLFELFTFNNETGTVTNPIVFNGYPGAYGLEFSPDESRLYLAKIRNQAEIFQVNLELENPDDIINSLTSIGISSSYEIGALQLGPDKKIYVSLDFSAYLGVINQPNLLGDDCDFVINGVFLDGKQTRLGLPNFVSNFFEADFTYNPDCFGDSTWFSLQYSGSIESVLWDFGDPASGSDNFSNDRFPFHIFSSTGNFLVKVKIFNGNSEYYIEKNIVIFPSPEVDLGSDISICSQTSILLKAGGGYDSYLWQDGSTDSVFLASVSGDFWVRIENNCGFAFDTIHIDFSSSFDIDLGNDTSFCYGRSLILSPGANFYSYYWQNGSTDSLLLAELTGYYWVQVTDSSGCTAVDTIYIDAFMNFGFSLGSDTSVICDGDYLFLHGPEGYQSYEWQDGSTYLDFLADKAGIYWLEITDENSCAARDSILLIVNKIPNDFLGNDTVMCEGDYFDIHAPSYYNKYVWQDGSSDSVFIAWQTGDYWVYVEDSIGCTGIDTISLSSFHPPRLNHSNDTLICPTTSILLSPGSGMLYYIWNTGETDSLIIVNSEGDYWVEMGTNCGIFTDSVSVGLYSNPRFSIGPDTNICNDETIRLSAGSGFLNYLWSDGSNDSILFVFEEGKYSVLIDDGRCLLSDTVNVENCSLLWVPNIFTPNGDGFNDNFFAVGEYIKEFKMVIFNRWGQVLRTLYSIDEKWDGSFNGIKCADAVYYWKAEFVEIGRNSIKIKKTMQGSVTLIRGN